MIAMSQPLRRRQFLLTASASLAAAAIELQPHAAHGAETPARIKVGQIGTGHAHAAGKMQTLRKLSDLYDVVGIVEPAAERRGVLDSAAYRGVPVLSEEQLLATPGLKVVAIETEVCDLVPTALRAVKGGLHVHVDKPAGESLLEFKALLDEATRRKLTVQMGYMFRYNPAFELCKRAVRDGWLGEVFELHGVMSKKVGESARQQLGRYAGGSMFELGCHLIDAVVSVLGKPAKVAPYLRRTNASDALADNQLAVFEYPTATATIRSTLVEPHGGARRQFVVCGTQGTVDIRPLEPPRLTLALEKPQGSYKAGIQEVSLPKLAGRYDGDFLDLARIVRGEKASDYPPAHDLAVHEAVLLASGVPLEPRQ
jgi:predicted dehydrogenase